MSRLPRLAVLVLPGLDGFVGDLCRVLAHSARVEPRIIPVRGAADLLAALAWADRPDRDALWFEFCWPPFPALIAATDFGGRRVIVRVHRIEAYGTDHVAATDWSRVTDVVTVGQDMAARVLHAAPEIAAAARLHVIHNGIDVDRFVPGAHRDPFRIGWCGWMSLHKNPLLALEVLHRLRAHDPRFVLHIASRGGEPVAMDAFRHLAARLRLGDAVRIDGAVDEAAMPAWHAGNAVLLSTSVYESFGCAIAEAAASGCDLAVLDNAAAAEFWPDAVRFAAVDEAVALIRAAAPGRWRGLVARRFSLEMQAGRVLALLSPAGEARFDPAAYWEERYRGGGDSGAGSGGRLAAFKAATVNALVARHGIASVIEFGCGDGRQLARAAYPAYVGTDVSDTALALCRARFAHDPTKRFLAPASCAEVSADLALSLDVIFHLVDDEAFADYMRRLFAAARRMVVIYASDAERPTRDAHVRHRAFTRWVTRHAPDWRCVERVPNPYPFDPADPDGTSFADFFVFTRDTTEGAMTEPS